MNKKSINVCITKAKSFVEGITEIQLNNITVKFYINKKDQRLGYSKYNSVHINLAYCTYEDVIEGTLVHELTHIAQRKHAFTFIEDCVYNKDVAWYNNEWEIEASLMECCYHYDNKSIDEIQYVKELFYESYLWNTYAKSMNKEISELVTV